MFNQITQCLMLASILFLISCRAPLKDDADYTSLDTLHIADSVLFKSLQLPIDASSLKYVKLETSANSIIARIDQLEIHQNIICILDGINNKIFLFKISGKFIRSLSVKDRQLNQFDIFDNCLYVHEKTLGKIYQYKLNGSLINVFNPGIRGGQFIVLHPGIFAYNTLGLKTDTKDSEVYQLVIYKNRLSQVKLPYREEYAGLKYFFGNQFSRNNSRVDFVTAFTNIFYRLDTSGVKALTKFDFGKYNMTDSVFKSRSTYNDYNSTPYITDLLTLANLDSISFHRFAFKGKEGYLLTDRKRKKLINGGVGIVAGIESDYNNPVPICSYRNKLVAIVEAATVRLNENSGSLRLSKQFDVANLKDSDNPFLMFYSLL